MDFDKDYEAVPHKKSAKTKRPFVIEMRMDPLCNILEDNEWRSFRRYSKEKDRDKALAILTSNAEMFQYRKGKS